MVTSDESLKRLRWSVAGQWKCYLDMWLKLYSDGWLKRLPWRLTEKATLMTDGSLKRLLKMLLWCVTEKATVASDGSLKRLRWRVTGLSKGYPDVCFKLYSDVTLKRLPQHVTEKAIPTCHWKSYTVINWKGSNDIVDYVFTELQIKFIPGTYSYKSRSWGRELKRIQSHRPHTMGSKEPEPWSS
jgi:hypothetical protein